MTPAQADKVIALLEELVSYKRPLSRRVTPPGLMWVDLPGVAPLLMPINPPLPAVELMADFSEFRRQAAELASLGREAGEIPELILEQLRALVDKIGSELCFDGPVATRGTGEQVIKIRFREGGEFDSCMAALRALRDGREFGHGGLRG